MGTYAAETNVSPEQSRMEIESTLRRWNAEAFMYGQDQRGAVVGFVLRTRQIRFVVELPVRDDKAFKWTNHIPPRRRTLRQEEEAYQQAIRQRWRALNLVIKAKLEAVESGIASFDQEFLAQLVLPNGQTVGDAVAPRIIEGIESNEMPSLLPDFGPRAIESA